MTFLALLVLAQADAVVLLRSPDESWRPFEQRLVAELQASGFTARAVDADVDAGANIPLQLAARCAAENARAALWFQPRAGGELDAWVVDRVTAKAVVRTYAQPTSGTERARLALRAVELLHASLLEVKLLEPSDGVEAEPLPSRFAVKAEKPHFTFGTGIGAVFTPGLRPQPLLELRLGYAFTPAWSLEGHAISSVFPTRVEGRGYGADVGVAMLRAMTTYAPLRGSVLSLGLAAATGALLLWATGDAMITGVEVKTEARVAWVVSGGLMAAARLSDGIRLQLLATAGVSLPEIGVQLAGRVQAWIGRPIVDAILRLEFE